LCEIEENSMVLDENSRIGQIITVLNKVVLPSRLSSVLS